MGKLFVSLGGGGGTGSDELTATSAHVLEDYSYVGNDTDDESGNGGMLNMSKYPTTYLTTTDPRRVHANNLDTDDAWVVTNRDGQYRAQIAIPTAGYYDKHDIIAVPASRMAELGGLSAAKMIGGQAAFGITGTALNDATISSAGNLISGTIAYGKNGTKYVGTLAVQSVLSFSAAPYSTSQITFTWKNPAQGAFSGVIIVGKTGSTPTSISDGTRWYKGSGNNTSPNGTSTTTVGGFTQGTTYYFRAFAYAIKDNAEWVGSSLTANATTKPQGIKTFTSSGIFTVPANVTKIDIFCVGGGGSGGAGKEDSYGSDGEESYYHPAAGGGGGGYTATKKGYTVTPGQTFAVTIGAGGPKINYYKDDKGIGRINGLYGGTTSFGSVLTAEGGKTGKSDGIYGQGGDGGSGGGSVYYGYNDGVFRFKANGASDGGSVTSSSYSNLNT